ncbi:phosphoserine phosphatase [Poseidonocella pacifica]|uniref:Phosphoserine phosphatase n=1 Tax=Poseidonocella pacifica TaxID=871651 RepID=A0A1I0WE73_9RHOB|nr:phosphoserine phosphatase SerB [Poseidonocella pacifica]SFA86470.1 phosphoserine phosphatase [Poseidonocella pacifica]
MHMVSMIARPGELAPAMAEALRNAWGGGDLIWLAPDEAAEFAIGAVPGNVDTVRAELDGQGIDLNIVTGQGRAKRLLLADMDSTMIEQECIDELAEVAGVGPKVREITARAMNGELDFEGALIERVALLKGLPESIITDVLATRISFMPGGRALLGTMKARGARCVLVSGGFTAFTAHVGASLGFDETRANTLLVKEGYLTGEVAQPILGRDAKVAALVESTEHLGIGPADVIAVGDGANDLGMLGRAGLGVALHAKPSVAAQCAVRVNHGDLSALLYLQGYSRDEFAA